MANEINVKIKTTADTSGMKEASKATKEYGDHVDNLGDKADATEAPLIGVHDLIDGTATIMQGPGKQGMAAYIQGWADVAGGAAQVIPLLKALSITAIKAGIAHVQTAAKTVASWIAMAATSMAAAAQMAIAWIIALGPIALVIAALVALGAVFVLLWKKSETFRDIVKGALHAVADAAQATARWFQGAFDAIRKVIVWLIDKIVKPYFAIWIGAIKLVIKIVQSLVAPFEKAFRAIANAIGWGINAIKDLIGWMKIMYPMGAAVVGIVRQLAPGGGGGGHSSGGTASRGFAAGGIAGGGWATVNERGQEIMNLSAGSRIRSNADSRAMMAANGGGRAVVVLQIAGDDSAASKFLDAMIRKSVLKVGGGSVQLAYGNGVR